MPLATTVHELMSKPVITVDVKAKAFDAFNLMTDHGVRHLPVINQDEELVGVISHRDLVAHDAFDDEPRTDEISDALRNKHVGDLMSPNPETVIADMDVIEACDLLLENKFGCLPVMEGDRVAGILTESDFVRHVRQLASEQEAPAPSSQPVSKKPQDTEARWQHTVGADEVC